MADRARAELAERLRARRPEIEQSTLTRVFTIAGAQEAADPQYAHGLRAAVAAAVDYGLSAIEDGADHAPPVPAVLLAQARLAAQSGISLDLVLRRYVAGYTLLGDHLISEAREDERLRGAVLQKLLRTQAVLFDRVVAAVGEEHRREAQGRPASSDEQRADRVRRLLEGELVDFAGLEYEFDGHHLGAIATGAEAAEALSEVAGLLDRRLLLVRRGEGGVWAWLGSRRGFKVGELAELPSQRWPDGISLAFGEPGEGFDGWRLTHRQARAAWPIALGERKAVVRYGDVALLASIVGDELLSTSLRQIYLAPLASDGSDTALRTLRAYFATGRNISSAAAALGIDRHTVSNRLRTMEEQLGRTLETCAAEIDAALRLEDLRHPLVLEQFASKVASGSLSR